ncbi:MAG: DUF983 domain-containing protein [Hyphomonadaceae bacterium]
MTALPTVCGYCDETLRRKANACEACGASFGVRETAVGSMYLMVGLMVFGLIVFGNAFYQTLKSGEQMDTVMQIVFPAVLLLLTLLAAWFWKQARHPRTWFEWHEGVPDFADMKTLEQGGTLSGLGGDKK